MTNLVNVFKVEKGKEEIVYLNGTSHKVEIIHMVNQYFLKE